jgi:putative pyruvate formate lyase activating enzyme
MEPSYLALARTGELARRAEAAVARLAACDLCPRRCGVDRLAGETGFCGIGRRAVLADYHLHYGEEACLVGEGGSGALFFSGCSLACVFCQNWEISRPDAAGGPCGLELDAAGLAGAFLDLQARGAENINLVSPTHVAAQVLEALALAADQGLALPLVWNSGGYDSVDTLRLFEGVADIYLPDAKVWNPDQGARLLSAPDYPGTARAALAEMWRQAGPLVLDGRGVAQKGLLVRHLVLPGGLAGSTDWMDWLGRNAPGAAVNVMGQYRPCWRAGEFPELRAAPGPEDMESARQEARRAGLALLEDPVQGLLARLARRLESG